MPSQSPNAETFRTLRRQLTALARRASFEPDAVRLYSARLLTSLFMIDNDFSLRDHNFINAVFGGDSSFDENAAMARGATSKRPTAFALEVPPFVGALASMDRPDRTQYALRALQIIRAMIFAAATSESEFTGDEADFLTTHISALGRYLMHVGVASEEEVVDAAVKHAAMSELTSTDESTWSRAARYDAEAKPSQADQSIPVAAADSRTLPELIAQLNALVGLEAVKHDVTTMTNQMRIRQIRAQRGLPVPPMSYHLVFSGNPGTGKTTVARILSSIYRALGAVAKGHLVETDRSGLVAGYVGQTAPRVREVAERARGGVLFIDEAYALTGKGEGDFGGEAIDTLLKMMEDHRGDLIVIAAGYEDRMAEFLSSNPGLQSRFNKFVRFPDYSAEELVEILRRMAAANKYELSGGASDKAAQILGAAHAMRDENFGNARLVRNLFEQSLALQANRLAALENPSTEALCLLVAEDIPSDPVLR